MSFIELDYIIVPMPALQCTHLMTPLFLYCIAQYSLGYIITLTVMTLQKFIKTIFATWIFFV